MRKLKDFSKKKVAAVAGSLVPTDLAPGVLAGSITGTVTNNAVNNAFVHSVTVTISSVDAPNMDATHPCDATDYTLSDTTMPVDRDVPAGQTVNFAGASLGFNNKSTSNQDGCKGATVHLAYASN